MNLTFDEIKNVTFGWAEANEEDGFLVFYKNTTAQREAWKKRSDFVYDTSCKRTGIRLDFYTDSDYININTDGGRFEILVNGLFAVKAEKEPAFSFALPSGENRVTVYLGKHDYTRISSVGLSDGATFRPATFGRKILFTGDSITEGWDSGYDFVSYANIVSRALDAESVINGCGGACYIPESADKIDFNPDIVIVAYGTNDYYWHDDFAVVESNVRGFFDRLVSIYPDKKIFVISPLWRILKDGTKECMGDFPEYCARLKKIYADYPVTVIDGFGLVPHDPAFFADGVLHPNALGFYVYAENLLRELKKYI